MPAIKSKGKKLAKKPLPAVKKSPPPSPQKLPAPKKALPPCNLTSKETVKIVDKKLTTKTLTAEGWKRLQKKKKSSYFISYS